MQSTAQLTTLQLSFLEWIIRGRTILEAAKEIDQSWAAIMEWRRSIPQFRLALEEAFECRALLNRECAQEFAHEALHVLVQIVRDEKASASLRLRASLAVIKMSTDESLAKRQPASKQQPQPETGENCENVHNSAQPQPIRRPVEPGRNSMCLCGSGLKFKRCCGNPVPATAAAEANAA